MGVRQREYKDKIGEYEDSMDNIAAAIGNLKDRIETLEERLSKAESILKLIHYAIIAYYIGDKEGHYDNG